MFHLFMTTLASIKFDTFNFGNQPFLLAWICILSKYIVPLYTVYKIRCQKSMRDQQSSTKFYIWWCFWVHTWFAGTLAFRQCLLGEVQLCVLLTSGKVSKIYHCFHAMEKAYIGMACCLILLRKYIHIFT